MNFCKIGWLHCGVLARITAVLVTGKSERVSLRLAWAAIPRGVVFVPVVVGPVLWKRP